MTMIETGAAAGQIHPQPWMIAAETMAVVEAFAAEGHEIRFIGGCVRDAVLKRPVKDIDLAVALSPQAVMSLLGKAGIRTIPTGIQHGTVTAVIGRTHFEITTLRRDVETYGRHAKVEFTDDWSADAARRDFTINALSCTPDGTIYDYFAGLQDLGLGLVRFVGDPNERIREDALRLLRFFRFLADYGRPPPDADALAACRQRAADVLALSGERVRGELMRVLGSADPAEVLQLMRDHDVLAQVLPEAGPFALLERLSWLESRALALPTVKPDSTRRLAALLVPDGDAADRVADRLRFSNHERKRLKAAASRAHAIDPEADPVGIKRILHRLGSESSRDLALLTWAGELSVRPRLPLGRSEAWRAALETIDAWQPVRFPLFGRDGIALGLSRGPQLGRLLREVEAWWEAGGCAAGREECIGRLKALIAEERAP